MALMFVVEKDERKCGGCNWPVYRLFVLADTQADADALYEMGEAGLCGECMCELSVDGERLVTRPFGEDRLLSTKAGIG